MANQEQLAILKQGVDVWNKWRRSNDPFKDKDVDVDLTDADLSGVNLSGVNFSEEYLSDLVASTVNLRRVNLSGANLEGANLFNADLSEANLRKAYLRKAELEEVNFNRANLCEADLATTRIFAAHFNHCDLTKADLGHSTLDRVGLQYANLEGVRFGRTTLMNMDISSVIGLEKVRHDQLSNISLSTIRNSKGKIPLVFLRGCGLSDLDIEYAKLANPGMDSEQVTDITYKIHQLYLGSSMQYYSCFISYSSKDQEFAQHLYDNLQNNGVRCWFDREDLKIGDSIRPTIDRQIRLRDKLLVILSENSIKSEWVGDEVEGALEEEQKGNRSVLFPIRLDDTALNTRDDWAAKIKRRRHIGDFSNWKDKASYQKAFERLLRDLKATG